MANVTHAHAYHTPITHTIPPHNRDISVKAESEGTFDGFWETLAFIINATVFAYAGAATLNFFIRSGAIGGAWRVDRVCHRVLETHRDAP